MKTDSEQLVRGASRALGTEPDQLIPTIIRFKKETEDLEKEISSLERQLK